jgi:hypothetical protein
VWRVQDPVGTAPSEWQVAFVTSAHVFQVLEDGGAGGCVDALAKAASTEDFLVHEARAGASCRALDAEGRARDALACILRGHVTTSDVDDGAFARGYLDKVAQGPKATPDLEDALYAILAPGSRYDTQSWDPFIVRDYLVRAPSADKKRALVTGTLTYCTRAGLSPPCASWRLTAVGFLIGESHDAATCREGLKSAEALLSRGDAAGAPMSLALTKMVTGCAAAEPGLAAIMRVGLVRKTSPDVELPSDDFRTYEGVDDECQDAELARMIDPGGRFGGLCESFPRIAGSWLARRCDAAGVAAAKSAIAGRPERDPRTDAIVDGAMRVLGRCARADFEHELARMPPGAKPDRVRSLLEP